MGRGLARPRDFGIFCQRYQKVCKGNRGSYQDVWFKSAFRNLFVLERLVCSKGQVVEEGGCAGKSLDTESGGRPAPGGG